MWISRKEYKELHEQNTEIAATSLRDIGHLTGVKQRLEIENERLRSDMDWLKHRLNQCERERGQFFQAQLGIKVAVPEFVPTYEDPGKALNEMPDLSTVGGDAGPETLSPLTPDVDYSMMPGYKKSE